MTVTQRNVKYINISTTSTNKDVIVDMITTYTLHRPNQFKGATAEVKSSIHIINYIGRCYYNVLSFRNKDLLRKDKHCA